MRPVDEPIPDEEVVYRTFAPGASDGPRLLPDAIDADGTSVCRSKYCPEPRSCLSETRPRETGVASSTAGRLRVSVETEGGTFWDLDVRDRPDEGLCHAQVCPSKRGSTNERARVKKSAQRLAIKERLADEFRVVIPAI